MLAVVFYVVLFETVVHALVHDLPRQTPVRERSLRHSGRTPKPTAAPQIPAELRRRQSFFTTSLIGPDETCGFISGLAGAAFACNSTDFCVMYPSPATGFGSMACCNYDNTICTTVTACVDSTASCDNGCRLDTNTLKCTESALPYCNSVRFPDVGVEDYTCDSVSVSTFQLAYTAYDGENTQEDGRSWDSETFDDFGNLIGTSTTDSDNNDISGSPAYPSNSGSDPVTLSTTSSPSSTAYLPLLTIATPSPSTAVGSLNSSSNSGPAKSTPVGAVVGGTIGGVSLIAFIAAAAFVWKRKYQKNDGNSVTSYPPLAQPTSSAYGNSNEPSEMEAPPSVPMQQHEFYKPQPSPQTRSPAAQKYQAYQPVPASEVPIDGEHHHQDEAYLSTSPDLGRASSTARVSMMTTESSPTSPSPNFSQPGAIFEAPGDYEYLEPPSRSETAEPNTHDSHTAHSPT